MLFSLDVCADVHTYRYLYPYFKGILGIVYFTKKLGKILTPLYVDMKLKLKFISHLGRGIISV
jgi:hypothetical protein